MAVELHCHTIFSVDAQGTPEGLVDAAAERGTTALSVAEHNALGSLDRARTRALERGIRYLPGVELDAGWKGRNLHTLGFGFDPDHGALRNLAERNFSSYAHNFEVYLENFERFGYAVSRAELTAGLAQHYPTHPAPVLNQWYARSFLVAEGVFPDVDTYNRTLGEIRSKIVSERGSDVFRGSASFEEVRETVHNAGGILLLAHVAQYHPGDGKKQIALIHELIDEGMDGFELYHPINLVEPHFDRLLHEAESIGCAVSGGSDCHKTRDADKNTIGCSKVPDGVMGKIEAALAKR